MVCRDAACLHQKSVNTGRVLGDNLIKSLAKRSGWEAKTNNANSSWEFFMQADKGHFAADGGK
jgi:hypothetical protein